MHEKRLTSRLIKYWELTKKEDPLPAFSRFNTTSIDDIWQNCMALEVLPSASREKVYTYMHCGDNISEAIGKNLTGETLTTHMKFFPGAKIIKRIDEVANFQAPSPLLDDGQFVSGKGKIIKYRACLLAFLAGERISHIVVGVSWREF